MAGSYVPAPSYPTPNYDAFGQTLGNLPADYQKAQQLKIAQQQEQMQLEQQKKMQAAFQGGLPMQNGQLDINQYMQTLAKQGLLPANEAAQLARVGMELQQNAPPPPDQFLGGGGSGPATSGAAQPPGDQLSRLEAGVAKVETGGQKEPYSAEGPRTKSGDRAYGKYQVMGANIPSWTEEVLGGRMTPQEFLKNRDAQEAVAKAKLGGYLAKYGDAPDAASMWFTGKPLAEGANKRDINGMSGARYAALATGSMNDTTPSIPPSASGGSALPRGGDLGTRQAAAERGGWQAGGGQPALGAGQTVASLGQGLSPNQQTNIAKVLGAPNVNAPLNPDQTQKLQRIIAGNYGGGAGQQPAQAGAPAAQAPGGTPLVRQPKLDPGFKTQEENIDYYDKRLDVLARYPNNLQAQSEAKRIEAKRAERIAAITPKEMRPGQMEIDPRTGQIIFQGQYPGSTLTSQAMEGAADTFLKTGKLPPNIGRGAQGKEEINAIMNRVYEKAAEQGLTPGDVAERQQSFGAMAAGKRILSGRVVGLELVGNEAQRLIPVLEKTIDQLGNGEYSDINAAINNLKKRSGNEDLVRLGVSAESLKSVYARVLKAGGTPTEGAAKKADDLFSGSWSKGQMRTALDQMKIELKNAKESVHDTMKEFKLTTGDFEDDIKQAKAESGDKGGAGQSAGATQIAPGWTYKGSR